jgi:hypothetical protein
LRSGSFRSWIPLVHFVSFDSPLWSPGVPIARHQ